MTSSALEFDFHNTWGSILGTTELEHRPVASALMQQYWKDPVQSERNYGHILSQYMERFRNFFDGTIPISFHAHVSDALNPVTVMGMLMRLAIFSKCDGPESIHAPSTSTRLELASLLGFTEVHLQNPRWAVVQGAYAAGYGPLANLSAHPPFHDHATGNLSIGIKVAGQSSAALSDLLSEAKRQGCIGVIVEIVSNQFNGRVTLPSELSNLSIACRENGLILAIDETITAIRCGSPWAYQRPEYLNIGKPDLVFFGKALSAQGIAINFDGPQMSRLGIAMENRRLQAAYDWQAVLTQALHLSVLINAIGVLEMATFGNWVGRSVLIGRNFRRIIEDRAHHIKSDDDKHDIEAMGGLESFIFVHKKVSCTFLVMGALTGGSGSQWVRWLPRMEGHLTDEKNVEAILLERGSGKRREISERWEKEGLKPQWCFYCGTWARGTEHPWCRTCCIDSCDALECVQQLKAHSCLL